jgi:GT2 family glycosyltransferase
MNDSNKMISIIFPSFNGENYIKRNLESIQQLSNLDEIELVIIDNNSCDSSREIIESYNNIDIKLINLDNNLGFAQACNIGAIKANGRYLFITNQDMIFPKDFFVKLFDVFKKLEGKNDIILCPAAVFLDEKTINYFGAKIHFLCFSYTPKMNQIISKEESTFKTLKAAGGCMFIKKKVFLELNGFDTYFFMYHEDTDFSLRANRNNIHAYTTNATKIIHQKRDFKLSDFTYYYIERNRYICIFKNLENLRKLVPYILITELMLIIQSFVINKLKVRFKIYKFFIQNYKIIKEFRNNETNCKYPKLKKHELSHNLDPILMGEIGERNKILKLMLRILNLVL